MASSIPLKKAGHSTASGDQTLIYTTLALVLVGLMSVYTASAVQADLETGHSFSIVIKQFAAVIIGFGAFWFCSHLHFRKWQRIALPYALLCIALLVLTMFMGATVNGSERWIPLGFGFQLQPSDMAKIAAVLLIAQATGRKTLITRTFFLNLALVAVMMMLILQQPNLSVAMIVGLVTLMMVFAAGLPVYILIVTLPFLGMVLYHKVHETQYQWRRVTGWLHPWKDPMDTGYNLIQSYYAIGSGGLFGVGLGRSIEKLYYLPFQHTDFIFSIICEEWGFVGAVIVMGLFALLAWRGFTIAWYCPDRFGKMFAFGLTLAFTLQALINICVTVGLMPVTGVTLPFISYGGTSMITTLAVIGILLNISRHQPILRTL